MILNYIRIGYLDSVYHAARYLAENRLVAIIFRDSPYTYYIHILSVYRNQLGGTREQKKVRSIGTRLYTQSSQYL